MRRDSVAVILEPDVAAVFKTSESVNLLLRSVIAAFPGGLKAEGTAKGPSKEGAATRPRRPRA
jgi:hypothetical protein